MRRLALAFLFLACGCMSNPYSKFYSGQPNARSLPGYVRTSEPYAIYGTNNFDRDVAEMMRRGFVVIGQSSFNGGMGAAKQSAIRQQAEAIGTRVVLVSSRYTNTVSGSIPVVVPKTSTTSGTATARVNGAGGTVTANVSGSSTTTSSEMVIVPYSVARGDHVAVFMAPMKPRLGLVVVAMDDASRQRIQSNFGVIVSVVVNDSPAFNADILPADVVTQIGGERVGSPETFSRLLQKFEGQLVEIVLIRQAREIKKQVQLATLR